MSFQNGDKNPFTETPRGEHIFQQDKFPAKMLFMGRNRSNGTKYAKG